MTSDTLFNVQDKVVAITGGAGVLGGAMCRGLAARGAKIAVLDFALETAENLCKEIDDAGGAAIPVACNVLEKDQIQTAVDETVEQLGPIDVLINGAGGNKKEATCAAPTNFWDLPDDAIRWVFELNCMGTILPSQIVGKAMAERGEGIIINTSSMNAFTPLTNIHAYSAAKAAVSNFTQWLAVYMAQRHNTAIRVNAIAPGFFATQQNHFLLFNEDDTLTPRGQQIVDHTPMGRFGDPEDLLGTLVWLISDAAKFVTGVVVPVDGGFNAFSGV